MSDQLTRFAQANYLPTVCFCEYCGEEIPKTQKYCTICRTQKGRKTIFDANVAIFKENAKKGIKVPESIKNWK